MLLPSIFSTRCRDCHRLHHVDLVAEYSAVELLRPLWISRLALVPDDRAELIRELSTVMGARLPDAERRTPGILRYRHAPRVEHVERLGQKRAARLADARGRRVDVIACDVGRPVRRIPRCRGKADCRQRRTRRSS